GGARPQRAAGVHRQRQDGVRRQAVTRGGVAAHAAVGVDPAQAARVSAQPDRIALRVHRPPVVAAQLRMRGHAPALEVPAARVHHAVPGALGRRPRAVARVHQQPLHVVAGQAGGIVRVVPPDPHADAVVARQPVGGGDPQVAGAVVRQRLDAGGGQPLRGAGHAETRALRHPRQRAGAGQPQQPCQPSLSMPHVPSPRPCWQRIVARASARPSSGMHRIPACAAIRPPPHCCAPRARWRATAFDPPPANDPARTPMLLKNTRTRWGGVSQTLHWIVVALVLAMAWIGLTMGDLPNGPDKVRTFALHKSIGLTTLALVVLRIGWRLHAGAPAPVAGTPRWQERIASLTHLGLYALLLAMPLSGWLMNSAAGFPLQWFGLFNLPALAGRDHDLHELAESVHEWLFWALA